MKELEEVDGRKDELLYNHKLLKFFVSTSTLNSS